MMMMMQMDQFQPSIVYNPIHSSPFDEVALYLAKMDAQMSSFELSSSSEDYSDISSSTMLPSTSSYPFLGSDLSDILLPSVGDLGVENFSDQWMAASESSSISCHNILSPISSGTEVVSMDVPVQSDVVQASPSSSSLVLPSEYMEVDGELIILHLLKALGDALGSQQMELAEEISRRLKEKASPTGKSLERLAFYLTLAMNNQANCYLSQESSKNYEAAFMAFYQLFPYGRFAHFTANSAILESIPADAGAVPVHIVDFDIGNGIQWPSLFVALARKGLRRLRLTSITWKEEEEDGSCNLTISFEETKQQLAKHAMDFGLRLEVEEMDMAGLVNQIKRARESQRKREWLVFNCMFGLPHMGKGRSLKHVKSFLKTAKALINSGNESGIITLGNGIGVEKGMECHTNTFASSFEGQMAYFQALLESMEQFELLEARIAMECLFLAPHLSSLSNAQEWECGSLAEIGLEPWRMSRENYMEAREVVREGESSYWVRTDQDHQHNNQMVLNYMGAPLVRVSSWK